MVLSCTSFGDSLQSLTINCFGDLPDDVPQESLTCFLDNDPNPIDCEMNGIQINILTPSLSLVWESWSYV